MNSNKQSWISFDEAAWMQSPFASQPRSDHLHSGWKNPQPTPLGLYYPLGPCRITFERTQLEFVLQTLTEVFRKLSLQTIYQDDPLGATCLSLDEVEFTVSMFESRKDNQIILEIHRYSGDSILYHRYARHILGAASGRCMMGWDGMNRIRNATHLDANVPFTVDEHVVGEELEHVCDMLEKERNDAQRLGLESLLHLTDPNKSGSSVAKTVAKSLLRPDTSVQEKISSRLLRFVCMDDFEGLPGVAYLSLAVLSQIFHFAGEDDTVSVCQFLNRYPANLVDRLLNVLHEAKTHPHSAFYAVRCLQALCKSVPALRYRISNSDVLEAEHYGDSHHLALANASHNMLVALHV